MSTNLSPEPPPRVAGLDTIRFVAAVSVVLHHVSPLPAHWAEGGWGMLLHLVFNGPAAVMVFFVLSGFVIHYPYTQRSMGSPIPFWIQRWIRIGLPAAVITVVTLKIPLIGVFPPWEGFRLEPLGNGAGFVDRSGLMWSLVAEAVYYGLYPGLRILGVRVGWSRLAALSVVPAVLLLLWQPRALLFNHFTHWMAWILGLPAWLSGCALAQSLAAPTPREARFRFGSVGLWRAAVVVAFLATSVLKEQVWPALPRIGYPWSLQGFIPVAVGWIRAEVLHRRLHPTGSPITRWLEGAGRWSYSVYLAHMAGLALWLGVVRDFDLRSMPWPGAILRTAVVLAVCYFFFLTVEWPSWQIARWAGRRVRQLQTIAAPQPAQV